VTATVTSSDFTQEGADNSLERPLTSPLAQCVVAVISDVMPDAGASQTLELNSDVPTEWPQTSPLARRVVAIV